ncbi:MAG: hypothetical protein WD800_02170 [Dehalococcoidia bacterium]
MIFIDRSIPRSVAQALQLVRDDVRWLEDEFDHDAPDAVWLAEVGVRGWMVITRDKHLRTRPAERRAILDGAVGCFVINQKQPLSRWEYLRLMARTLDDMEARFVAEDRPFIYLVNRYGGLRKFV